MTRLTLILIIALLLFPKNVSAQDNLGVPCSDKAWFARNLWDMVIYQNLLFAGCGDYDHDAGPIDVWVYGDSSNWVKEYTVAEEEIKRFRVLDGVLTIPGTDATEDWSFGNWYERLSSGWVKHRNIPNALHVFDIFDFDGLRFAAMAVNPGSPAIAISDDGGNTWRSQIVPAGAQPPAAACLPFLYLRAYRIMNFFTIGDQLFADTTGYWSDTCANNIYHVDRRYELLRWDGQAFQPLDVDPFPGLSIAPFASDYLCCMISPTAYGADTIYIGQDGKHSMTYAMGSDLIPRPLNLSDCSRPQDIDTDDGVLFVLCNQPSGGAWRISLRATCDLEHWLDLDDFTEATFARSFAVSDGTVYFGLGADSNATAAEKALVGTVYRSQYTLTGACASATQTPQTEGAS